MESLGILHFWIWELLVAPWEGFFFFSSLGFNWMRSRDPELLRRFAFGGTREREREETEIIIVLRYAVIACITKRQCPIPLFCFATTVVALPVSTFLVAAGKREVLPTMSSRPRKSTPALVAGTKVRNYTALTAWVN